MQGIVHHMRIGNWLSRERVRRWLFIIFAMEILLSCMFVAGTHGWLKPLPNPTSTDFVSFYAAGRLADSGTPWLAYDRAMHHLVEQQSTEPGIRYNYFYYPPTFLIVCALLARLPYLFGFFALQAATLAPCLLIVRAILRNPAPIMLLAFPAVFWTLGTGQNAFLTASLFGSATLLLESQPILAGLLFGALCYKPHFGLLIPVALAAGGYWRCIAGAAISIIVLTASSLLLFGWDTWQAFLTAAVSSQSVYATNAIDLAGLTSPYGALLVYGAAPAVARTAQAVVALLAAALVALVWRRVPDLPIRAAVLIAATPVAVPIVMFYDLMLTGVAMAWLIRAGLDDGFPPWSRTILAVLFMLPLLSGNLDSDSHLLIAPLSAMGGFLLALGFAWRARGERQMANPERPNGLA